MATTKKSVFETLSAIDISSKVEKKNGLSYLSWAWAWSVVKQHYPTATYTIYENHEGYNYHHDGVSAWVKTGVTIEDIEHIEYLPIMDFRNRSIMLADLTSFEVNKTIQRSLTKAIARHGLGLYIYAGDDLPAGAEAPKEETTLITLEIGDENWDKVMRYVVANKDKGLKVIGEALKTKYSMSAKTKKAIAEAVK